MNNQDNIINNDPVLDANDNIITSDNMEIADKQRIMDDNARRMAGNDHVDHDSLILENEHINDNPARRTANDINPNETYVDAKGNVIDATDPAYRNDPDDIDRSEVKNMSSETKSDLNADMITGEPGSHPIGTGLGGVGGAAAGAAIGSMAGPLGTLIGGAIGAIVGGGAGHASAEAINPTREEAYWRAEHANANYYQQGQDFERDLHPAYAVGYANRARYPADARFEDHEEDLRRSWEEVKGDSRMEWEQARLASSDAWNRVS